MTATVSEMKRPILWTTGDWNAFFGFGTNILVNMLTLTALLRFVLKMPDALVFGRILPAVGLMMVLSTMYYAFLAYRLASKTDRSDVCALPSGISVPHMFIVTFVIMLPISLKTGDPEKGWQAGLVWVFFQSFILMIGGFIAPYIRRITPRAALLGTLAGGSRRDHRRHRDRLGLERGRPQLRRLEHRKAGWSIRGLRLLAAAAGFQHGVFRLRISRHHFGDRDTVRHL